MTLQGADRDTTGGVGEDTLKSLNDNISLDIYNKIINHIIDDNNDNNLYEDINIDSQFYDLDTFINRFANSKSPLFINLNIQSLMSKHDKLNTFIGHLNNSNVTIDIIALQETWTVRYPHLLTIPGYQPLIFTNRSKGRGGDVGFYVRNGLNVKILDNLSPYQDKLLETLTIDISYTQDNTTKHYLATSLYRSPSPLTGLSNTDQLAEFNEKLDNLLNNLNNLNTDSYIFTDSNINLLNLNSDTVPKNYMNNLTNNGYLITNLKATRMQNGSSSMIDHILCNCKMTKLVSGTIIEDISDHFVTFIQPNLSKHKTKPLNIKQRLYTQHNLDRFKTDLQQLTWNDVLATTDVDNCYNALWDNYTMLHDIHFPLTTTKFNKNIHKIAGFMTRGLLTSRQHKLKLHKTALTDNTADNWHRYRTYRNIFNKTIKASKRLHYETTLQNNAKKPQKNNGHTKGIDNWQKSST